MAVNNDVDFVQHDYRDNDFIAIVINSDDPTFSGRCQARVLGLFDGIEDKHLPWAVPMYSNIFANNGAGNISIPKKGQFVRIQFNNGDIYSPEYTSIQNLDTELINRIKEDYLGTHVLLHDPNEELIIIFQKESGIQIYHKESYIQITPDTLITLSTPNGDSIIQMDGDVTNIATKNDIKISAASKVEVTADEVIVNGSQTTKVGAPPYYSALLAEPFWSLLSTMATALDSKMPATPGVNVGLVEAAKQAATSTNVKIGI